MTSSTTTKNVPHSHLPHPLPPRAASPATVTTPGTPALEWSHTLCDGKRVNHAPAAEACAALGPGWRLPTPAELVSIVDYSRYNPAIDTERFPDTKSDAYWTDQVHASDSSYAWVVYFSDGSALSFHRAANDAFVRAVRASPAGQ